MEKFCVERIKFTHQNDVVHIGRKASETKYCMCEDMLLQTQAWFALSIEQRGKGLEIKDLLVSWYQVLLGRIEQSFALEEFSCTRSIVRDSEGTGHAKVILCYGG